MTRDDLAEFQESSTSLIRPDLYSQDCHYFSDYFKIEKRLSLLLSSMKIALKMVN